MNERKKSYHQAIEANLANFDYTVFDYSGTTGINKRQTWAEAFPSEINSIVTILRGSNVLKNEEFAPYFLALADL